MFMLATFDGRDHSIKNKIGLSKIAMYSFWLDSIRLFFLLPDPFTMILRSLFSLLVFEVLVRVMNVIFHYHFCQFLLESFVGFWVV